jgi:prepilin-type N-terminal cleavage/methylation domain-containing protein/prepilin-type processing-associated H-X9-DG protein
MQQHGFAAGKTPDCLGCSQHATLVSDRGDAMKHLRKKTRRGFTLVELLVVIGIIAVLISILLPTLGKAHAAAKKTQCLSNIRQVHQMFALYATENNDQVPLGYRANNKQFNSMVYSNTSLQYVLFGLMYKGGYMDSPQAFFCPSENNPQSMYASEINPWPPGPDGDPTKQGYCGYGCRPDVNIPDVPPPGYAYPKLPKFKNLTILADLTAMPARVLTRHGDGINILRGDGSARWVPYKVFEEDIKPITGVNASFNSYQDRIWKKLDQQ